MGDFRYKQYFSNLVKGAMFRQYLIVKLFVWPWYRFDQVSPWRAVFWFQESLYKRENSCYVLQVQHLRGRIQLAFESYVEYLRNRVVNLVFQP